ncbi:uncharacterized protein [Lepeophtheirus salmonis]|uniref:uncharacterized protein n=1 Tax=Lepeophtheirus salmonis TaxID=72036 RepID=UPI001AE64992|nr:uncharacterized protein LOC121115204 [Lepeophtheirus salmonis]
MLWRNSESGLLLLLIGLIELAMGLKCYTDIEGKTIRTCKESEGFRTCFTKFNDTKRTESERYNPSSFPFGVMRGYQEGTVTGRGCSTKDKVFYKECETHSYGDLTEKMCFCSFFLCNRGSKSREAHSPLLVLSTFAVIIIFLRSPPIR